jgi:hypothetical protein
MGRVITGGISEEETKDNISAKEEESSRKV